MTAERPSRRESMYQLARFILVGLSGTLVYAGVAYGLLWNGADTIIAHAAGTAISLAVSYLGQKIFTYQIAGRHKEAGVRFIAATAIVMTAHAALVFLLNSAGINANLVLLAGILFYPPASYLIHTFWTFRLRN